MVAAAILALVVRGGYKDPVSGPMFWEELPYVQQQKGFHPFLRFGCWEITRFNRSTTYMFTTPDFIQQGQYDRQGDDYAFRAVMANDLENADIAKLTAAMDPESGRKLGAKYARSMSNFQGSYDSANAVLAVTYLVDGRPRTFQLHMTTEGDDQLAVMVSDADRGLTGLWHAPEPNPDRLDAHVRYKIGDIDGLRQFAQEAGASEGAQFGIVDLRVDGSFRIHGMLGRWHRKGSTVVLEVSPKQQMVFTLSADGTKLLSGGRPAFIRN